MNTVWNFFSFLEKQTMCTHKKMDREETQLFHEF
jgi:hypothetical protein